MAQLMKCLLYKQENLSLNPRTHVKSQACRCVLVILGLERRQADPWGSLASQVSSERLYLKKQGEQHLRNDN